MHPADKKTDPAVLVEVTPDSFGEFDVEFTLKTTTDSRKLAYIGVGGDITAIINPDLIVQPGEIVRVILVNGDGLPQDLFPPDWDVKTDYVAKIGDETEIVFEVGDMQSGSYVHYCTGPGHRQADQKGKLIIAEISE